jgi:hypothetical protein
MRFLTPLAICLASGAFADGFDRPIPQAQSATAEFWFGLASIALIAALFAVHKVLARR